VYNKTKKNEIVRLVKSKNYYFFSAQKKKKNILAELQQELRIIHGV
jgi:hypothetical protein